MRLGIVNDVSLAAEALRRAVRSEHEVAWTAVSGESAVDNCLRDLPDLVLMDMVMPGMNGVETTRRIMEVSPCPILVVTSDVDRNAGLVFDALGAGAMDVVATPVLHGPSAEDGCALLLRKIQRVGRLVQPEPQPVRPSSMAHPLLAIGASSGGPAALAAVLGSLPADLPAPVLVGQHLDERFVSSLARWLDGECVLPVRVAVEGERPAPGEILVADSAAHLAVQKDGSLGYRPDATLPYVPSIDVLFDSISRYWSGSCVGILLTGMGKDGAAGLLSLRQRRFHTIAQDEATSAVYGMPRAAAELSAAVEILALEDIGPRAVRELRMAKETRHV